jgi:hypothetical protein
MGVMTDERRDEVVRELTRHCGDGRLTLDELEERIAEAYAATNDAELEHSLRELPRSAPPAPPTPTMEAERPRPTLPPLPPLRPVRVPTPPPVRVTRRTEPEEPEWHKRVGTIFFVVGIILMVNGAWLMALLCWFVLPGLVMHKRHG